MSAPYDVPVEVPVGVPVEVPPRPGRDRRARELVGVGLWALAAGASVGATLVPWFGSGLLSSVSPMDGGELLRTGVLDVPAAAGFGVLLLPVLSLLLLGLAPLRGGGVLALRVLLWLVSTIAGVALVAVLGRLSGGTIGLGGELVIGAAALGAIALCFATVRSSDEASSPYGP